MIRLLAAGLTISVAVPAIVLVVVEGMWLVRRGVVRPAAPEVRPRG